jgi:hypothetical protein
LPLPLKRFLVSVGTAVTLVLVIGASTGPLGYAVASAVAFLVLAWRHDNQSGACFPLAVLFLLAILALLLLFYLVAAVGAR